MTRSIVTHLSVWCVSTVYCFLDMVVGRDVNKKKTINIRKFFVKRIKSFRIVCFQLSWENTDVISWLKKCNLLIRKGLISIQPNSLRSTVVYWKLVITCCLDFIPHWAVNNILHRSDSQYRLRLLAKYLYL